jgi:hypothetical protein
MEWTRSETLALANHTCTQCHGMGLRMSRRPVPAPCNCVFRSIFRTCYQRFRKLSDHGKHLSIAQYERREGKAGHISWGRKDEEYIADFCKVSQRILTPAEHRLFRYHFLLGADWRLCCRKLNTDRGTFFHAVYRIEEKLGRAFRELEPYSLFPLDEYFFGTIRNGIPGLRKEVVIPIQATNRLSDRITLTKAA